MTDPTPSGCICRFVDGVCGNPPTSGLPICGPCLRTLLDEADPRRRRTLATQPHLAAGLIQQLAEDPDDQVRAQVAARNDLDTATTNRLANPDRETAALVWRSIAATAGGATHAWELLGTDDPTTLSILAANPRVDPDILDQLSRYPNPDVSWTASATLAGQPAGDVVERHITEARAFDGLPVAEPALAPTRPGAPPEPVATDARSDDTPVTAPEAPAVPAAPAEAVVASAASVGAAPPTGPDALPPRPAPPEEPQRNKTALLVGAGALVVIAIVLVAIVFTRGGSDTETTAVGPDPDAAASTPAPSSSTSTSTSTTSSTTTTSTTSTTTTTVAPTLPPTTVTPPAVVPPSPSPISQNFTIRSNSGRFCNQVSVTVNYSPSPAYVVIRDDTGAQVGGWSGPSGQTNPLTLPRPTTQLQVQVTALGAALSVSGSASGDSC